MFSTPFKALYFNNWCTSLNFHYTPIFLRVSGPIALIRYFDYAYRGSLNSIYYFAAMKYLTGTFFTPRVLDCHIICDNNVSWKVMTTLSVLNMSNIVIISQCWAWATLSYVSVGHADVLMLHFWCFNNWRLHFQCCGYSRSGSDMPSGGSEDSTPVLPRGGGNSPAPHSCPGQQLTSLFISIYYCVYVYIDYNSHQLYN